MWSTSHQFGECAWFDTDKEGRSMIIHCPRCIDSETGKSWVVYRDDPKSKVEPKTAPPLLKLAFAGVAALGLTRLAASTSK